MARALFCLYADLCLENRILNDVIGNVPVCLMGARWLCAGVIPVNSSVVCIAYNALLFILKIVVANDMNLNRCCYLLLIVAAIGSYFTLHPLVVWLLSANMLTLMIYGVDKIAARKAWRRVPESTLLVFGVVGGWAGAIAGQQLFRHKTQKQPFKAYFIISVILSVSAMAAAYQLYPH